jgi:hypothetical protein
MPKLVGTCGSWFSDKCWDSTLPTALDSFCRIGDRLVSDWGIFECNRIYRQPTFHPKLNSTQIGGGSFI